VENHHIIDLRLTGVRFAGCGCKLHLYSRTLQASDLLICSAGHNATTASEIPKIARGSEAGPALATFRLILLGRPAREPRSATGGLSVIAPSAF
jgi:hypothetical protein